MKISTWTGAAIIGVQLVAYSAIPLTSARAQEVSKCAPHNLSKDYPGLVGKTITIGADPESQPYVYRDPKDLNRVIGSDADLARAVFDCMGIRYRFDFGTWSGLLPAVMAGHMDVMWNELYYTPERAQKLDYVIYAKAADGGLTEPTNPKHIHGLDDLCGLTAASMLGTVEEVMLRTQDKQCKEAGKPEIDIMTASDHAALARLLVHDRADLMLNDLGLTSWLASNRPDEFHLAFKITTGYHIGVGISKGKRELLNAIYEGMRIVQANGTQARIYERYKMDPSLQTPAEILTK